MSIVNREFDSISILPMQETTITYVNFKFITLNNQNQIQNIRDFHLKKNWKKADQSIEDDERIQVDRNNWSSQSRTTRETQEIWINIATLIYIYDLHGSHKATIFFSLK